ncbi:lipid II:glycine glycyltransferase FemX [Agrococcus sp. Marseille-P2731]|uniref:lipid II:glycine glycyltransferase FemX n=1 Tax=Agrococcus sp. Marseille-P2731 TaxID=1841862 RepID=UPI000930AE64|nr:GNAT family N-acetyltransferase [Agrococcus sp. Marseille-P2731]
MTGAQTTAVRFATDDEIASWDSLIEQNPDGGIMTSARAMGEIKRYDRLTPRFLVLEGAQTVYALAHEGTVWLGRYWYIPLGPTTDDLEGMVAAIRAFGMRQQGLLAIKVEPHLLRSPELIERMQATGAVRSRDMQLLTHTVVLDLSLGDDLIMQFQKKLRSSIRGAENKGYRIERIEAHDATEHEFERFYELLKTINGGKGVAAMREYAYYRLFWGEFAKTGNGRFYFGYDDDSAEAQAAIFVTLAGRTAVYKDGGSRPSRAIAGGAALLLWRAMQDAAADGKAAFDLCGTPKPESMEDETHWYYGVGQFKKKFGPVVSYLPSFDIVLRGARHNLWERAVRRVEWRIKPGTDALR